jgi:hypothetical protein
MQCVVLVKPKGVTNDNRTTLHDCGLIRIHQTNQIGYMASRCPTKQKEDEVKARTTAKISSISAPPLQNHVVPACLPACLPA